MKREFKKFENNPDGGVFSVVNGFVSQQLEGFMSKSANSHTQSIKFIPLSINCLQLLNRIKETFYFSTFFLALVFDKITKQKYEIGLRREVFIYILTNRIPDVGPSFPSM